MSPCRGHHCICVEAVTGAVGAVEGPASSAKRTFDVVVCFIGDSVSSSDGEIIRTDCKDWAIRLKFKE